MRARIPYLRAWVSSCGSARLARVQLVNDNITGGCVTRFCPPVAGVRADWQSVGQSGRPAVGCLVLHCCAVRARHLPAGRLPHQCAGEKIRKAACLDLQPCSEVTWPGKTGEIAPTHAPIHILCAPCRTSSGRARWQAPGRCEQTRRGAHCPPTAARRPARSPCASPGARRCHSETPAQTRTCVQTHTAGCGAVLMQRV